MNPALNWALGTINSIAQVGYTGKIEVNFFQGGVSGLKLEQTIKPFTEIKILPIIRPLPISKEAQAVMN